MSDPLSPDGVWRWDGTEWVPNTPVQPPIPQFQPPPSGPSFQPTPAAPGGSGLAVVALIATLICGAMIALQIGIDTSNAFGDNYSYSGSWAYSLGYELPEFGLGVIALATGLIAGLRTPRPLTVLVGILAGAVSFQAFVLIFYRLVVNHFGYGNSF